ncbi:5'-nucleotidase C-terminal domain-containing protein [Thiomicrospira microaerophila]|uniref:5'-nucleotidase C-terminal domain-containing protein n=1 Tax=Thiomicrospira microaerophila TaxID=406020 RepID=UPI00200E16F5|nr:5'-nucleotidase C-terminal domain-containing protein [Thiomicrospira microaerophila]UQB43126.1 5'-nucleotidase C-terminal domain-containing protein [Thiomicrospira microaerophila]
MKLKKLTLALFFGSSVALTGCLDSSSDNKQQAETTGSPINLTLLHMNDHHSNLDPTSVTLTLNDEQVAMTMGGFPRVVGAFKELETNASGHVLKLHAGDAITGTLYYTLFKGEADAAMMNQVCFDAFALGNHEFDGGDEGLKEFIDYLHASDTCPATPILGANVKPQVGTVLAPNAENEIIKPYVIKEFNGEKVGIIGIDIKDKTQNSSSPASTTVFLDEVETAQAMINELEAQGVNKIILLTHYQFNNDVSMASQLTGVDIIVGGDSHTLLGDFNSLGLNSGGDYPTITQDAAGSKVCVVQAWDNAKLVGELNVSFDAQGRVESCEGTPHLLVDGPFRQGGEQVSAEKQASILATLAAIPQVRAQAEDQTARNVLTGFSDQVDILKQTKIGETTDNLCIARIPGDNRGTLCTAAEKLPHGGDIQMLVAHAFREMAKRSDIAIQNAGGVRIEVPAGDLTIGTAYTLLPFSNTLVELTMTGDQIRRVLEDAVDNAIKVGGSDGAYPYAAGLRWDVDLSQEKGARISNLEFKGRDDANWTALNASASYVVVTNDFIAAGRDGYTTFTEIQGELRVDTFLDYAQSFVDYVEAQANNRVSKLPYSEYSTQNYTDKDGLTYTTKAE